MKLPALLSALPNLSQLELAMVRAAVDRLLDGSATEDETTPLYGVVSGAVGRGYFSYQEFHKMTAYRTWRRDAPPVVHFIDKTFPDASNKVTRMAIMTFLVRALIDDMKMLRIPITLGTVAQRISYLPQVLDRCFPGYVESGLTHLIVKAMERK